jgi:hypothetical protein
MAEFVKKTTKNDIKWRNDVKITCVQPQPSSFRGENVGKLYPPWNPGSNSIFKKRKI